MNTDITVTVHPTRYEVCALPADHRDRRHYVITVENRGRDRWAVVHNGLCLAVDGEWDDEPSPSEQDDQWLYGHQYDFAAAMLLARDAAPNVEVNGRTATEVAQEATS